MSFGRLVNAVFRAATLALSGVGTAGMRYAVFPAKKKGGKKEKMVMEPEPEPTYDTSCKLVRDERTQSIIYPMNGGDGSTVANFLPNLIGHTQLGGYAFTFEKDGQETAFKHFYRGEFGNSCSLVKNLLAGLKENGFNWLFMQEAKSSDPRATVGYLLGDMTRVYDALPLVDKVVIEVATNSGYYGNKVFIVDQYNQYDLHAKLWLPLDQTVLLEMKTQDEIEFIMNTDISLEDSKARMVNFTEDLFVGWSKPQVLLTRAGHTFAFTNPYGKGVADITTPIFIQYGDYNTGKTTLLQYCSACHGILNGKVQQMSLSKIMSLVCTSSRTFVPVDDPPKDLIDKVTEALHNGCGSKNNRAGCSLRDQDPIRSAAFSCKEFVFSTGIWSKIVMIYCPVLSDNSVETQVAVDDLAPKFSRYGPDCVRYNLEFVSVWDDWEKNKNRYLSDAMSVIPEEMVRLSRTPRNFSYLLPFVEKMLEEKDYGIRYEQVLQYARESFGKLLRKLQLCNLVSTGLTRSIDSKEATELPGPVLKVLNFLEKQPQKKCFIRECGNVDGANISRVGIALRGATTSLAGASNFKEVLVANGIKVATRPTFRFLGESSEVPYIRLAKGGKVLEGKLRTTNAIIFDSETKYSLPFMKLIEDQDNMDGYKFNGDKLVPDGGIETEDEELSQQRKSPSKPVSSQPSTPGSSASPPESSTSSPGSGQPVASGSGQPVASGSGQPVASGSGQPVASGSGQHVAPWIGQPDVVSGSGQSLSPGSSPAVELETSQPQRKRKKSVKKEEDEGDQLFCRCRGMCAMAAYCSCRKQKRACSLLCHTQNIKCKNK